MTAMHADRIIEIPQWGSDKSWDEANASIAHVIRIHSQQMRAVRDNALAMAKKLTTLFPLLDEFCMESCVYCSSPCCVTATVWLDFCDLIFIHLTGQPVPPHQLIEKQPDSCRFSSDTGCILPRLSRPWVCTHYLCPPQKALLRQKDEPIRAFVDQTIVALKTDRAMLERLFLSVIR